MDCVIVVVQGNLFETKPYFSAYKGIYYCYKRFRDLAFVNLRNISSFHIHKLRQLNLLHYRLKISWECSKLLFCKTNSTICRKIILFSSSLRADTWFWSIHSSRDRFKIAKISNIVLHQIWTSNIDSNRKWLLLKWSVIGIRFKGAETSCGIAQILGILLMNSYGT